MPQRIKQSRGESTGDLLYYPVNEIEMYPEEYSLEPPTEGTLCGFLIVGDLVIGTGTAQLATVPASLSISFTFVLPEDISPLQEGAAGVAVYRSGSSYNTGATWTAWPGDLTFNVADSMAPGVRQALAQIDTNLAGVTLTLPDALAYVGDQLNLGGCIWVRG